MVPSKGPRGKQAHHQDPRTGCDNLIRSVKIEIADACNEKVREDKIGKSPKDVDGRRRKALTGRLGERTLEGSTHHPADEVRDGIGEDGAAEEVGRVVKPVQDCALLSSKSLTLCVVRVAPVRDALHLPAFFAPRDPQEMDPSGRGCDSCCLNSASVRFPRFECGRTSLSCLRQLSITIFASTRLRNHSIDRHSSRNFPLKGSWVPFCHGLPGSISAVSIFSAASHLRTARQRNSEPLSERRFLGPRAHR